MNHKYKKPRQYRDGCHYCKPHKIMGNSLNAKKIDHLKYISSLNNP